mgnify:CR=1 FL=1
MNLAIWDIESSSANTSWGSIIEVGGVLVDANFKELDRFNFRCRLPEGEVPQAMALIVNKTSVDLLTKGNLSHYQMLSQLEAVFKKWSPAIFMGWSNIGFDDEMIRNEFFRGIRYPYITNATPNKRHDGLNIARGAHAVDESVVKTEINAKGNAWIEMSGDGDIQIYSEKDISYRAKGNINIRADKHLNLEGNTSVNIAAGVYGEAHEQQDEDGNQRGVLNINAGAEASMKVMKDFVLDVDEKGSMHLTARNNIFATAEKDMCAYWYFDAKSYFAVFDQK